MSIMSNVAVASEHAVARPLKILENLIRKDFEAAEHAGRPFEESAGEKLIEAQEGHFEGNTTGFYKWAEKKFRKTRGHIKLCMAWAVSGGSKSWKSKKEVRYSPKDQGGLGHIRPVSRPWTVPVDDIAERARKEAFRLAQEDALTRAQERDAERALAHRLIDIGYKVLAKELHPDKMHGDREAMKRLNHVRDKLKHSI
jgi:hypothetical protein